MAAVHELLTSDSTPEPRKVQLLDPHTINQIAAGEVVERPASVLKELVENALDAGAARIGIQLVEAGRRLIEVRDDGSGMSEEDVVTCLERHATSKIRSANDLSSVLTLGFRGEAIPSIASVSRFSLSSGVVDGLRKVVEVEGGQHAPVRHEAGPKGTTVRVEDLFFNTPARLKFLKSDATELHQCIEVVSKAALMHPHVAFVMTHGDSVVLETHGQGERLDALAEVWGKEVARSLAEMDAWVNGIRVRGYVSTPAMTRANRAMQWIFVNGRPVRSRSLTAAIDVAYRSLTPDRRYAIAALILDVDPGTLDVNVSPTKSEVKFQNEGRVFDAIRVAIRQALMARGMIPSAEDLAAANDALAAARSGSSGWGGSAGSGSSVSSGRFGFSSSGSGKSHALADQEGELFGTGGFLATSRSIGAQAPGAPGSLGAEGFEGGSSGETSSEVREFGQFGSDSSISPKRPISPISHIGPISPIDSCGAPGVREPASSSIDSLLDGLRILGQMDNTFILAENRRGLLIIDQHVAHERVLYEQIRSARGQVRLAVQPLLSPETIHVTKAQAAILSERLDELTAIGFELEPFGGESFLVRTVPADIRSRKPLKVLRDLIDELTENPVGGSLTATRDEIWILASCKMAIKAGDPLSIAEMEKLLVDLAATENPYLCPHGRPITLVMERDALMRKFKRG